MPVTAEIFAGAVKHRREALRALLAEHYPRVYRMAYGLSGKEQVGDGAVRFIMTHAMQAMRRWRDENAAERWFYHHTILAIRRAAGADPDPRQDRLVREDENPDPAYIAFVRAVRQLPFQQREAFLLHYGEHWNMRSLAVAMDCSTQAAEVHLHGAEDALAMIVGDAYADLRARVMKAYSALSPPEDAGGAIDDYIARGLRPRRARRIAWAVVVLVMAAVAAWVAWRLR